MAISTDVPIYTTTLPSNASSVTIPLSSYQQYTNLKIVIHSGNAGGLTNTYFTLNSDGGSNYSWTRMYGTGSTPGSSRGSNTGTIFLGDNSTSIEAIDTVYLMNYSNTNMYKTVLIRSSLASSAVQAAVGTWRGSTGSSTEAITSITFTASGNSFLAGSTFDVYGIGSGSNGTKATGGAIYTDDTYVYHAFTSTGAFVPSQALNADILVVAGGGAGGDYFGGGGGAGGAQIFTSQSLTSGTSYTCTVGAGAAKYTYPSAGTNGGNSQFGSLTASIGGGYGASGGGRDSASGIGSGGSGGGGASGSSTTGGSGTSGQGYAGGNSAGPTGNYGSAGGGGAGAIGGYGSTDGGAGGVGITSTFINQIGAATGIGQFVAGNWYIAGGGGGAVGGTGIQGPGGYGGGGIGCKGNSSGQITILSAPGSVNTGGGGGGGWTGASGGLFGDNKGGSGVVVVRYLKA